MRVVYISSYKPNLQTKNLYIMSKFNMHDFARIIVETHQPNLVSDLRMQAVRNLFDGLTFDQATNTSDWDELTCDEQMRLEDLINSES